MGMNIRKLFVLPLVLPWLWQNFNDIDATRRKLREKIADQDTKDARVHAAIRERKAKSEEKE